MLDLLLDALGFGLKASILVLAFAAVAGIVASLVGRRSPDPRGHLRLRQLNRSLREMGRQVRRASLEGKALKKALKADKKADKAADKARDKDLKDSVQPAAATASLSTETPLAEDPTAATAGRIFILDFDGDVRARRVAQLREEVTALIAGTQPGDEVLLRLTSPGGAVTGYGLAASQLARLRDAGLHLTVAIDQVAASGGYMMACVAQRIIAAPFAVVGSIGVVATVPNVRRLLARQGVEVEQLTAGTHKRTLSMLGENTDEGRAHFQADLDDMHQQFKDHVAAFRPHVDISQVATGAHWTAERALTLGMVDELLTSDDWLLSRRHDHALIELAWQPPTSVGRRLGIGAEDALVQAGRRLWQFVGSGRL